MSSVSYDYNGSVVAITGGARGLGAQMAREFARAGARVAVCDVPETPAGLGYETSTPDELAALESELQGLGAETLAMPVDVREEEQVASFFAAAAEKLGPVDVLINNAGVIPASSPIAETTLEQWDVTIDVNLKGPFLCTKHAVGHMNDHGRVVIIGSTSSLIGIPFQAPYQVSKHGVLGAVKSLALELAPRFITVNAVCPTITQTPMFEYLSRAEGASYVEEIARLAGAFSAFPGVDAIEPEDVVHAVLWLSSSAARYVTGTAFTLDAGFTIK